MKTKTSKINSILLICLVASSIGCNTSPDPLLEFMVNQEENIWQQNLESQRSNLKFIGPDRIGFYQTEFIAKNETIPVAICINPDLVFSGKIRELEFKFNLPNISNGDTINGGRLFITKKKVEVLSELWINKLGKPIVQERTSDSLLIKWSNSEFDAEFFAMTERDFKGKEFQEDDRFTFATARITSSKASEMFETANQSIIDKRSPEEYLSATVSQPHVYIAVDKFTRDKSYIIAHDNIDFRHLNKFDFRPITGVRFSIGYFDQFGKLLFESPTYDFIPEWPIQIKPIWELYGGQSPNGMKISFSLENLELEIANENTTLSNLIPAINYEAITLEDGTTISQ